MDAIGDAISFIKANHAKLKEEELPKHTIFSIMTDGLENASREYNLQMVRNLIDKLKKQDWTFAFIGTDDLDVEGMASSMGIQHHLSFSRDEEQTEAMFVEESASRLCYYNEVSASVPVEKRSSFFRKKHV